jgi:hypothetical protein
MTYPRTTQAFTMCFQCFVFISRSFDYLQPGRFLYSLLRLLQMSNPQNAEIVLLF